MRIFARAKQLNWLNLLLIALCLSACNACQAQQPEQKASGEYSTKVPDRDGIGKVYMGREIAGIMSAAGGAWLQRDTRPQEENTSLAIASMELRPNSVVADIGAGNGYYTFRIAPNVPEGKVYAIDVQDAFLEALESRKKELGLSQVEVVKGGSQSINLPDNSLDLAFMVDVYHELEYPKEMLQSIRRALKPDGKLVLMEYRAEDPKVQIKELHKMSARQVTKELNANGFKLYKQKDVLPIQHFLMFEKAAE
ncbi:class I SAM-dependent methyltransferase [uncultured Pontibacter sp.]|uniref:class I SAM-dependent methyltransferase n=1 Tax=uncultured Pontibacter sp. TaxID=453356 RepID=UPI002602D966|nr:class I SAM-dependent methyltransferase [uncultured Pontibacter sp.]